MAHEQWEGTFTETKALLAAIAEDEDAVEEILANTMQDSELRDLESAAQRLASACWRLRKRGN